MNHATVLYVENDDNDVLLIRRAWMKAGVRDRLQTVTEGEEAIRYLSSEGPYVNRVEHPLPRLVLLDVKLSGCPGSTCSSGSARSRTSTTCLSSC